MRKGERMIRGIERASTGIGADFCHGHPLGEVPRNE